MTGKTAARLAFTWALLAGGTGEVLAETMSLPVEASALIQDGSGSSRVLLRIGQLDRLEGVMISGAELVFPSVRVATPLTRVLHLQLFPITRSWDAATPGPAWNPWAVW